MTRVPSSRAAMQHLVDAVAYEGFRILIDPYVSWLSLADLFRRRPVTSQPELVDRLSSARLSGRVRLISTCPLTAGRAERPRGGALTVVLRAPAAVQRDDRSN
jgi:hypothetical protein